MAVLVAMATLNGSPSLLFPCLTTLPAHVQPALIPTHSLAKREHLSLCPLVQLGEKATPDDTGLVGLLWAL